MSMNILPLFVAGCFILSGLLTACMADEDYSVSAADRLTFSVDTVRFDTVISGQPTNTYTFQVYNRNSRAMRINRVDLAAGVASVFRVNVDGTYLDGGSAADFEIASGDSLRVFLEMTAAETGSDLPVEVDDDLVFTCGNGLQQKVHLEAFGQDVLRKQAVTVTEDETWEARRPYHILDSLVVAPGATLTLGAGTRLYFQSGARLIVRGTLKAAGTVASPVMLRGDRMGNMFSEQPYDRIPGQWGGMVITSDSYGNVLEHCDIHSGSFGIRCDSSDVNREKLQLRNSVIHNVTGDALYARMSYVTVVNSQLSNAGGDCVALYGGDNVFIHCTIANFYAFSGGRGVALSFTNEDGDVRLPLYNAAFFNCIVTGYSSDEIMGQQSTRYEEDAFNYVFRNCLLNTPETEDARIVDCVWDNADNAVSRDGNFSPEFDLDKLIFTFTLSPESRAVNAADPEISREYAPADRLGVNRFDDGAPDMGCYELKAVSEN